MAAAPAPTYAHAIPSLSEINPTLPALGDLDINRAIVAATPIDPANLSNAKFVVKKLKATLESPVNPGVTEEMVESAMLRLRAVEGAHTAAKYGPSDLMTGIATILQRLDRIDQHLNRIDQRLEGVDQRLEGMDQRLEGLDQRLDTVTSMTHNHRIIARNAQNQPICEPLHKTVAGSGFDLARALAPRGGRAQAAPGEPAPIGTQPPNFTANITMYTNKDISGLITFYNDDFGIIAQDDEATRRTKFIKFLTRY